MNSLQSKYSEGLLLALVGPTGSGKSTLAKFLVKKFPDKFKLSISTTSRQPRSKEKNNVDYIFISNQKFEEKIKNNDFFEWEKVHDNYYGTLNSTLDSAISNKKVLVLDIDIQGALNFKKHFKNQSLLVFLSPPTKDAILDRIKNRDSMPEVEINRRLATSKKEYSILSENLDNIDFVVVNDNLDQTKEILLKILNDESLIQNDFDKIKFLSQL